MAQQGANAGDVELRRIAYIQIRSNKIFNKYSPLILNAVFSPHDISVF